MALTQEQKYRLCSKVILHWWANLFLAYARDLGRMDIDGDACPFCTKFHCQNQKRNCPVEIYTGADECFKTPWYHIRDHLIGINNRGTVRKHTADFLNQLEKICDQWMADRKVKNVRRKRRTNRQ
jgi:hypothetical protein